MKIETGEAGRGYTTSKHTTELLLHPSAEELVDEQFTKLEQMVGSLVNFPPSSDEAKTRQYLFECYRTGFDYFVKHLEIDNKLFYAPFQLCLPRHFSMPLISRPVLPGRRKLERELRFYIERDYLDESSISGELSRMLIAHFPDVNPHHNNGRLKHSGVSAFYLGLKFAEEHHVFLNKNSSGLQVKNNLGNEYYRLRAMLNYNITH